MRNTYSRPSTNTTKLQKTGKVNATFASPSHGIAHINRCTYPCQVTVKKPANISITPLPLNNNINHTPIRHAPTAPNNNLQKQRTLHPY